MVLPSFALLSELSMFFERNASTPDYRMQCEQRQAIVKESAIRWPINNTLLTVL
jgi:hypothetical protein